MDYSDACLPNVLLSIYLNVSPSTPVCTDRKATKVGGCFGDYLTLAQLNEDSVHDKLLELSILKYPKLYYSSQDYTEIQGYTAVSKVILKVI